MPKLEPKLESSEPSPPFNMDNDSIMKMMKKQQDDQNKMKESLQKSGINMPEGMNFGGNGMTPEMAAAMARAMGGEGATHQKEDGTKEPIRGQPRKPAAETENSEADGDHIEL